MADDVPPRLLLIDDAKLLVHALAQELGALYRVAVAFDGLEALELLQTGEAFDVIVCDLDMPRMNGIELYVRLRRDAADHARRFMFFTGSAPALAGALGDVPVLGKPANLRDLVLAIEAVRLSHRPAAAAATLQLPETRVDVADTWTIPVRHASPNGRLEDR